MICPRCLDEDWWLFAAALALSAAMHLPAFSPIKSIGWNRVRVSEIELDITRGATVGLPVPGSRGTPAVKATAAKRDSPEWTLPKEGAKEPEQAAFEPQPSASSESEAGADGSQATAGTAGQGRPGVQFTHLPHLLNLSQLKAILERYYPETERRERREAKVVLDLHIDAQGNVTGADIVQSGGLAFDEAARQAARRLRYSPAYVGPQAVAVKLRQAIEFKLK